MRRGREEERVAERAGEAGLVTVGEHVPAHVHEHDQVGAELGGGGPEAVRDRGGPERGVHEHRLLAEQLCHPRLGEQHPAVAHPRRPAGREHSRRQRPCVHYLGLCPWARLRVDRPALPRDTAHDRARAVSPARLGRRERAHHVATAADAEHQRAARGREQGVGVAHRRISHAICAWRSTATHVASASAGVAPTPTAP